MFIEKIYDTIESQIKVHPIHTNRASDIGHPCIRYHVSNRTRWDERKPHDVGLELVFNLGNVFESMVIQQMLKAGIQVQEQQKSYFWKEYNISGHIDGRIYHEGKLYPFDIKSSSPYVFDSIDTIKDLKKSKYQYLHKYPVQLNLYLLMEEQERGLFIFVNKVTGKLKEIWMSIDYDLGEETLKKCEAINAHVAAGTIPDPIEYDDDLCGRCPYAHICLPERVGQEVEIDDNGLSEMLDRFYELKQAVNEYDDLLKQISKMVEGREKVLAGDYFVTGKWVDRREFVSPASRYWKRQIVKA